jgi:YVTN family beta-propeller protein
VKVGLLPYTVVAPGDGSIAYVAANGAHSVFAVDTATRRVISRQAVGRNPWSIATNPAGKLLVANNRSSSLSVLQSGRGAGATALRVANTIAAGSVTGPGGETARAPKNVALSTDGSVGIFTDLANNQVVVVDTSTGKIRRAINVGKAPYGLDFIH